MRWDEAPPSGDWPSFRWEGSGWWFGICGTLATVFLSLAPGVVEMELGARLLVAGTLFASPLALLGIRHLVSVLGVFVQRARWYPSVYRRLNELEDNTASLKRQLQEFVEQRTRCEILRVHWFEGEIFLLIQKRRGKQPEIGAQMVALDLEDGGVMAELELTKIRSDGYYAKVSGYIDPVWYGRIAAKGIPEQPPPPNTEIVFHTSTRAEET